MSCLCFLCLLEYNGNWYPTHIVDLVFFVLYTLRCQFFLDGPFLLPIRCSLYVYLLYTSVNNIQLWPS